MSPVPWCLALSHVHQCVNKSHGRSEAVGRFTLKNQQFWMVFRWILYSHLKQYWQRRTAGWDVFAVAYFPFRTPIEMAKQEARRISPSVSLGYTCSVLGGRNKQLIAFCREFLSKNMEFKSLPLPEFPNIRWAMYLPKESAVDCS